ncbi:T9SS type A sorting domain-containing protein [bacterium]|nr:T9SS type A sorting domain-containing protein [bacterium]
MYKKMVFIGLIFILSTFYLGSLWAQIYPVVNNPTCSARGNDGNVYFNVDAKPEGSVATVTGANLFYSTSVPAFSSQAMTNIGSTDYVDTWQCTKNLPASGTLTYYFRTKTATNWATEAPNNSSNQWPPNTGLLAQTCDEASGDLEGTSEDDLDLTGSWVGFSGDKLYVRLSNDSGDWTFGSFFNWNAYSFGFQNPDNAGAEIYYALTYIGVTGVYETGLFRQTGSGGLPTRIGNIDTQISGNDLYMRCNISDITSDAEFGTWTCGYLTCAGQTLKITGLSAEDVILADDTQGCYFYQRIHAKNLATNNSPTLTDPGIGKISVLLDPDDLFHVTYTDANNNVPTVRQVVIEGTPHTIGSDDHKYDDGSNFDYDYTGGYEIAFFRFCDGRDTVETADIGISDYANAGKPDKFSLEPNYPNPFNSKTTITIISDREYYDANLTVTDINGKIISNDMIENIGVGTNFITWEPGSIPSGIYFYSIKAEDLSSKTGKMLYAK